MLPLLPWRKRVLCLTAISPVPSSKEKRLASTLLSSRTLTWTCPSVTAKQTPVTGKTRQPRAVAAWPMAHSRWELSIEAAGQQVTTLERYVTHVLRNVMRKYWEYSITSTCTCTHTFSERSSHLLNSHLGDGEFSFWLCQEQSEVDPDTRSKAIVTSSFPNPIIKREDTTLTSSPYISELFSESSVIRLLHQPPSSPVCSSNRWEQQEFCNILWKERGRVKQHY